MIKKKLLLACLCAAILTGCGKQEEDKQTAQTEANVGNEMESEAKDDTAGAKGESEAPGDMSAAKNESEVQGNLSEAESETKDNTSEPVTENRADTGNGAEDVTGGGTVENESADNSGFTFGDKATMDNNVNGRELPIYCVDTEEKKVALSFDAAWGDEDTQELLAILEEHDLRVTFFMTGGWVESYPEDVKAILAAGHDLGNHSENHKNMSELSDEEKEEEIMSVHRKVKEITGYDMCLFRPPYGDYDNALIDVLKENEYYAIQWDVDSLDWKNEGVDAILETVLEHKNLGNGSIILCHNGGEYTAEALDTLINELEAQGYEIVPISELIYPDHYHMNVQGRQISDE